MQSEKISYKRHRFPPDIIAHAVWLYVRSNLSLREVKEMLLEPGIDVSYETIRRWTDRQCVVLEEILQSKRATKRLLLRLIKCHRLPKREVVAGLDHWSHKSLNNRAKNSHLSFRKRERAMQGFRSPCGLQRFVSIHSATRNCIAAPTRRRAVLTNGYHRMQVFEVWAPQPAVPDPVETGRSCEARKLT